MRGAKKYKDKSVHSGGLIPFKEVFMSNKPFKTYEDLIKILQYKGLKICDENLAKEFLERENYYSVINGYKSLFLDNSFESETFKQGTKIEEIFSLFLMDRELKKLLFYEIIKAETFLKSITAHNFHKKFEQASLLLDVNSYTGNPKRKNKVEKMIETLKTQLSNKNNVAVFHYTKKGRDCPLWVLVNYLTFGNMSKFYFLVDDKVRADVSRDVEKYYNSYYNANTKIFPSMVDDALGGLVMFRNVCAHDERLYTYKHKMRVSALNKVLDTDLLSKQNVFSIVVLLKLFLKKEDYKQLIKGYENIFIKYEDTFKVITIDDIKNITGYDVNWIEKHLN